MSAPVGVVFLPTGMASVGVSLSVKGGLLVLLAKVANLHTVQRADTHTRVNRDNSRHDQSLQFVCVKRSLSLQR